MEQYTEELKQKHNGFQLSEAEIALLEPEKKYEYLHDLKVYRDNYSCLEFAYKKGLKQGIKEVMDEYRAKGDIVGMKMFALDKAISLLKKYPEEISFIASATQFSEKQIRDLKSMLSM